MATKTKSGGTQTILWWVLWISLTIVSFFAASSFWTPLVAKHFGSVRQTRAGVIWVAAVFGTWMLMLLPLIIVMYQKVDKAYDDARMRREKAAWKFRSIFVEKSRRMLPPAICEKMKAWSETIDGGHLVSVILKDGRKIPHVFISGSREILGIYDFTELPFEGEHVIDIRPEGSEKMPVFLPSNWLRLDGASLPD